MASYFGNVRSNDLLRPLGLQRVNTGGYAFASFALFGAGLLVGAGVALLFAPKTGRELRDDLGRRANQLTDRVRNANVTGREGDWASSPNVSTP